MTPEQVKRLAQPLAELYEELTDELMEKIAEQLATHGMMTDTAKWQITKLAQAGKLNQETLRIIAQRVAVCPELTEQALRATAYEAISTLEPQLQQAARLGLVGQAAEVPASARVTRVLQTYQAQAKDVYNLVNTVMAYKARDAYTGLVNRTADMADRVEYLSILGKNTASVVTGQQARQTALRQCIREFAEKGLPGFVDRAGREWSPEAYINMDIRTTVARVATESQFARMDDYGADLISVSSHIGARPRCEPFQGKIYSRSGKSGFTEDLNGGRIPYAPWNSTSYGEAAGLLGINCGHQIYPFFPGLSHLTYQPYQKDENNRVYAQSQRQRYLERQIRASKRECAMLEKLGDQEGFSAAATRLKQREQKLRDFTAETGRSIKRDRVQVPGFGRSQASKAAAAAKAPVIPPAKPPIAHTLKSGIIESKSPNKTFDDLLRHQSGMDDRYADTLKSRFSAGSSIAQAAFVKYVPDNSVLNYSSTNGAFYSPAAKRITMNFAQDAKNPRGAGVTWFHEHGHLIDSFAGRVSTATPSFSNALKADYDAYLAQYKAKYGLRYIDDVRAGVSSELVGPENSSVSDLFGGLSGNKCVGDYGHWGKGYWQRVPPAVEAFAHMYEAQFDSARRQTIAHYFPTALAEFERILGEIV